MATYGVGVANKFDLLDDEDHPTTKVVKEEKAKPQQTKTKPVVSEKPAEEPKSMLYIYNYYPFNYLILMYF